MTATDLRGYIRGMSDARMHQTPPSRRRLVVTLPPRMAARLEEAAAAEDRSRTDYVRELLRRELLRVSGQREAAA